MSAPPKIALVLSGGGARGAYEAGVLRYILEEIPRALGRPVCFSTISGTSVGALNAAWLAATIDHPERSARRLWYLWRTLRFSKVVSISYSDVWRTLRKALGEDQDRNKIARALPAPFAQIIAPSRQDSREGGLLRTSFFDSLVRNEIPFANISRNFKRGLLDAISVSTTDIVTGRTTIFIDSRKGVVPPWTHDFRRIAISGPMTAQKILASAAIPLVFPAVKIGNHWYCDGGIRQNTPIAPALRLGADKLLVISLQNRSEKLPPISLTPNDSSIASDTVLPDSRENATHPNLTFMLGKLLDAILLDPLDYDLSVLKRINALLRHGEEAYNDPAFSQKLNEVLRKHRGQGYRYVDHLLLRSSQDLGRIAAEVAANQPDSFWGSPLIRRFSQYAIDGDGYRESDLLSYLLFDGHYTGKLLNLGYRDAHERHDELVEFFR